MFSYSLISSISALIFLPDYHELLAPAFSFPAMLIIIMFFVSVLASSGFYMMKLSMEKGPHGLIWAIIQAAMIIPFTLSIFIWNEPADILRIGGICLVFSSFLILAVAKDKSEIGSNKNSNWIIMAIISFLLVGFSQILSIMPSHYKEMNDTCNIRVPLIFIFSAFFWLAIMLFYKNNALLQKGTVFYSLGYALTVLAGQITLYKSIDLLTESNKSSIAYPLSVGICIIVFSLYSICILKENIGNSGKTGLALIITGIFLIAIN